MLFKRFFKGKPMLKLSVDAKNKSSEKCSRRKSECDGCWEHSNILEETMKVALLGVVLWIGLTFGSHVAPYPLNLLVPADRLHPPPMYDYPFPTAAMLRRLPPITTSQTNRSIAISKFTVSMLRRLEENLHNAEVAPKHGSSAQGLLIQGYPSEDAMHYEKSSMIITKASQNLVNTRCAKYGLRSDECASFISTLNLADNEFGQECAVLERFSCRTSQSRYRTFDGSCNNPVRSSWGQALTGYKRLLHPRYADGIEEPRRATNNHLLPSARLVSTKLADNLDKPDSSTTIALAVWSQFIYHDLAHTPVRKMIHNDSPIRCCDNSGSGLAPRYIHPSCMPISVPSNDPFFAKKEVTCMEYTRSITTYRGDCTFGAAEQMNQATHFLDGSQIYGSTPKEAASLRLPNGGLLKFENYNDEEFLPLTANPKDKCMISGDKKICFNSGDTRVNMHPWLSGMHTIWAREHNRIARNLAVLNPTWSSDKLYYEARRVVVAELQHITYSHWLPALTGESFDELYESFDAGYNSDVNPTITNAFATAVLHFVNSLLDEDIQLIDDNGNVTSTHRLADNYYNPEIITSKGALEKMLRGMISQSSQELDFNYDNDVWHSYLGGLDALAVDIQRGRDHGLPAYFQYRVLSGLPHANTFKHLDDVIPKHLIHKLSSVYENVGDIDLVVGGMAETPLPGSRLGPTFTYLIKEQMHRTRSGDRFFYSHSGEAGSFNKRQLIELKRASLARLLCDNVPGIESVQRDVFAAPSDSNPMVPCDEIKKVRLDQWQDASMKPDILTRTKQNVKKWIKEKVTN